MALLDLPRFLYKWILGLIMKKPAKFIAMRYYDVKNALDERKERKTQKKKDRKKRVRTKRSSGKTRRRT